MRIDKVKMPVEQRQQPLDRGRCIVQFSIFNLHSAFCILLLVAPAWGLDAEEFKVRRQEVFEFAAKPTIRAEGDRVEIGFASKAYCDATVAVEDSQGRIVRHLASGVLGKNAPEPFQKDTLSQRIVWDGKDDRGKYVEDRRDLSIRVSLGLRARFERNLFWLPYRRVSGEPPLMKAIPQGVAVFDGGGFNYLRLFDHDGNYARSIYPFPAGRIRQVPGLWWHTWPQDGRTLPVKLDFAQTTMLTSGTNTQDAITYKPASRTYESVIGTIYHRSMGGTAATAMDIRGDSIALAHLKVNRLSLEGPGGRLPIEGGTVSFPVYLQTIHSFQAGTYDVSPRSAALSPDGKWLYLAGYLWNWMWHKDGLHGVARVRFDDAGQAEVFAGSMKKNDSGREPGRFRYATSVACDSAGRVYAADYMNDRIQVFSPDGKFLKAIPASKPVQVWVHPKNSEIFIASWYVQNNELAAEDQRRRDQRLSPVDIPPELCWLGPFDNPTVKARYALPLDRYRVYEGGTGHEYHLELDFHTDPVTVWAICWGPPGSRNTPLEKSFPRIYQVRDGKLVLKRDLGAEAVTLLPTVEFKQRTRLYVNPASGRLYVAIGQREDGTGAGKAFQELMEIDSETGRCRRVALPFDAEDMAFSPTGLAVLRGFDDIGRYDPKTWREVPWDYGEERESVGFSSSSGGRRSAVASAVRVPGTNWHMGGLSISPRGRMAVTWYIHDPLAERRDERNIQKAFGGQAWQPRIFPGRAVGGKRAIIHVYDEHGRIVHEDAVPGLGILHGVQIDRDDSLYVLSTAARVLDGARYFNDMAGTLVKFRPGQGRIISTDREVPVQLSADSRPKDEPDLASADLASAWVQQAEWMYGGVGWGGKNRGVGCDCINCQFAMDYFGRCFAPETDRYSVAVLDSEGSLLLRIGQYGNADDGLPLDRTNGPPSPRPVGADEVALYHGAYLATHTDSRLFICDVANSRIVGVRLDYHATERVPLN